MKKITKIIVMMSFLAIPVISADDNSDSSTDQQQISDFINSAKSQGTGIAQSFGAPLGDEYKESFGVFNDTPKKIFVGKRPITNFQGANIYSDIDKSMILGPYQDSGLEFYNMHLRFGIVVDYDPSMNDDTGNYSHKINKATQLSQPSAAQFSRNEVDQGDPTQDGYYNPYIIRSYMRHDYLNIEFLSQITTSSRFAGVFYNNTDNPVKLTFIKDTRKYTVTLDPHSCNNLESSERPNSIRPPLPPTTDNRSFVFSGGGVSASLNIPALGFVGTPYTYEIFKGTVGIQGLSVGNFDMVPLDGQGNQAPGRIRDINPIPCSFWVKRAVGAKPETDAKADTSSTHDLAERYDLWFVYKTNDQSIMKKLQRGKSNDVELIRPQLAEKEAWFYVFLPLTSDEKKIVAFLTRVGEGKISIPKESVTLKSDSFSTLEVNTQGMITDAGTDGSGISAYLMLADVFLPLGLGSLSLYYSFEPSVVGADQLAYLIMSYIDTSNNPKKKTQDALLKEVTGYALEWIRAYAKNQSNDGLKKYLLNNGIARLFKNPQERGSRRQLSDYGQMILTSLTTGKVSLANYPVLRYAGTNDFMNPPDGFDSVAHVHL